MLSAPSACFDQVVVFWSVCSDADLVRPPSAVTGVCMVYGKLFHSLLAQH